MPPLRDHFEIRAGGIDDLDAVFDLWQQLAGLTLREEDTPEHLQALLLDRRAILYVVESSADIVGAVLAVEDGRRGYLHHLGVTERRQGLGLGRALVEVALGELAARGIQRSHVFVQIENDAARSFWSRLGWHMRTDLVTYTQTSPRPERRHAG